MIYDRIEHFKDYINAHQGFAEVAEFLDSAPLAERQDGRHTVSDTGAYVSIDRYQTRTPAECVLECHRKYIDIQVMIEGTERMGVCHKSDCVADIYDPETDFQALQGTAEFLEFRTGTFMVFFPQDAHMPQVIAGEMPATVRKAVFKVPQG